MYTVRGAQIARSGADPLAHQGAPERCPRSAPIGSYAPGGRDANDDLSDSPSGSLRARLHEAIRLQPPLADFLAQPVDS
jgi:hypothetical protein